ncbi:MAG TPA: hypothetical protein PLV68_02525, partial [Ilumatobacteraceae bacterium]|nr:hypothetical protein [Ilumatobacteraceae bacterium]
MTHVLDGVPDDNTTLTAVLDAYAAAGFAASFGVLPGGVVRCDSCATQLPASSLETASLRRMEGASDPDDMLAVVAMECPACQSRGVLVLGYGPASSAEDG